MSYSISRSQRSKAYESLKGLSTLTKMDVLRKVSEVLGRQFGITVVFRGNIAVTDGKTITVPSLPDDASDDLVNAIIAYVDHEAGHIRFTDFDVMRKYKIEVGTHLHSAFNAIEDIRQEAAMTREFRGVGMNFDFKSLWTAKKCAEGFDDPVKAARVPPFNKLMLMMMWRSKLEQGIDELQPFYDKYVGDQRDIVEAYYPSIKKWHELPDSEAAYFEAKKILDDMKGQLEEEKKDEEEKKQQQGNDSKPCDNPNSDGGEGKPQKDAKGEKGKGDQKPEPSNTQASDQPQSDDDDQSGAGQDGDDGDDKDDGNGKDKDDDNDKSDKQKPEKPGKGKQKDEGDPDAGSDPSDGGSDGSDEKPGDDNEGDGAQGNEAPEAEQEPGEDGDQEQEGAQDSDGESDNGAGEGDGDQDDSGKPGSDEADSGNSDAEAGEGRPEKGVASQNIDNRFKGAVEGEESNEGFGGVGAGVIALTAALGTEPDAKKGEHELMQEALQRDAGHVSGYRQYTDQWDNFCPPPIRDDGDSVYRKCLDDARSEVNVVYQVLSRSLMAKTMSSNSYGKDSGRLNINAIAGTRAGNFSIFKRRKKGLKLDTYVHIEVDHSGSMGGRAGNRYDYNAKTKLRLAQETCIILAEALSRGNVPFSVSGFSTGFYEGPGSKMSQVEFEKLARKSMADPNFDNFELVDPVTQFEYKRPDEPLHMCRKKLGSMVGNCRGANADGMSIWRTVKRMMKRPESRKILIVLSDGQPACTQGANIPGDAAASHLKAVVKQIEKTPGIEIIGIGIGDESVKQYYTQYAVVHGVKDLPAIVTGKIKDMLMKGMRSLAA